MEEADQILIVALRQIGVKIGEDVASVREFTAAHLVAAAGTVINLVEEADSDARLPTKLPANVAGRHRLGQKLGDKIKGMGYTGECGYNQFLYPNERDTRKLLMWLVEKIPKTEEEKVEEVLGANAMLNRSIVAKLDSWRSAGWVPHYCGATAPSGARAARFATRALRATRLAVPPADSSGVSAERKRYHQLHCLPVTAQPAERSGVPPSLVERNSAALALAAEREAEAEAAGLEDIAEYRRKKRDALRAQVRGAFADAAAAAAAAASKRAALSDVIGDMRGAGGKSGERGTAFSHQTEFAQESAGPSSVAAAAAAGADVGAGEAGESEEARKARTEAALVKAREDELAALQARIDAALATVERAGALEERATARLRQATAALASEKGRTAELEKAFLVKKQTLEMLPEAPKHIANLQRICAESAAKLVSLAAEWETHRRPMLDSIRQHKESKAARKSDAKRKVEDMKRMRSEMKDMAGEIRAKEDRARVLAEEYERMPKDVNRILYTHRIMDIIKQNRKQKVEITKIIGHIREVQREINVVTEKLQRTEVITDERIYQAAAEMQRDPAYTKVYRSLAELRDAFDKLIELVQASAHTENETRDLESRCQQLEQRSTSTNMERIANDLAQVKKENEALAAQLRAIAGARR